MGVDSIFFFFPRGTKALNIKVNNYATRKFGTNEIVSK